jgi:hypothetical protein
MNRRIYFQKLFDGHVYDLSTKLEVLNWMLQTGKPFRERGWPKSGNGMDKAIFDYSANCHDSYHPLPLETLDTFITAAFANVLVRTPNAAISKWREAERVDLSSYRILNLPDPHYIPSGRDNWPFNNLKFSLLALRSYVGCQLKKESFHPDYTERTEPKIISIKVTTAGYGFNVDFQFSFKEFEYEPGWTYAIGQKGNECLERFILRVHNHIRSLLHEQSTPTT